MEIDQPAARLPKHCDPGAAGFIHPVQILVTVQFVKYRPGDHAQICQHARSRVVCPAGGALVNRHQVGPVVLRHLHPARPAVRKADGKAVGAVGVDCAPPHGGAGVGKRIGRQGAGLCVHSFILGLDGLMIQIHIPIGSKAKEKDPSAALPQNEHLPGPAVHDLLITHPRIAGAEFLRIVDQQGKEFAGMEAMMPLAERKHAFRLRHGIVPRPVLGKLKRKAVGVVHVEAGGPPDNTQEIDTALPYAVPCFRVGQIGFQGQLGDVRPLFGRDVQGIALPRLPWLAFEIMQAQAAQLFRLRPARDMDVPLLRLGVTLWNGKAHRSVFKGDAVLQCLHGFKRVQRRRALAGHQRARRQGERQDDAHRCRAVFLFLEQVGQPPLEQFLATAEIGGQGRSPAPGGGMEQYLAIAAAEAGVFGAYHLVVAAQLQIAGRLPHHPPHQGIEPVHGVGQQQQGLIRHVPPAQMHQLVPQYHVQLLRLHLPAGQQDHRPHQAQHHGGGQPGRPAQSRPARYAQLRPQGLQQGLRRSAGLQRPAEQAAAGNRIGDGLPEQEPRRARHPDPGAEHCQGDLPDRAPLLRDGLRSRRVTGAPARPGSRHMGVRRHGGGGQAHWIHGRLHRHGGLGQRELERQKQPQGQQQPEEVAGFGRVAVMDTAREQQQGQQYGRTGQGQDGHPQKQSLHAHSSFK